MSLLRLHGPDAARYLNGQVTQSVADIPTGQTRIGCVTNHKGKIDAAPIYIHHLDGAHGFLIESPAPLFDRLDRYLIADDCELEEADGAFTCVHILDRSLPRPAGAIHDARSIRFGTPGRDLVFAGTEVPGDLPIPDPAELEALRIANQVPAWDIEATAEILPPEIPFFRDHAISYTKGCYIGQEVISRIKAAGKVRQELRLLTGAAEARDTIRSGMELVLPDDTESVAGVITSVADRPDSSGALAALGFVRRAFSETGRLLNVRSGKKVLSVALKIGETPGDPPDPSAR